MKKLTFIAIMAAASASAQTQQSANLPSDAACAAVRERAQLALGQADRALQAQDDDAISRWAAVAANYSTVYAAFCQGEGGG